MIIYVVEGERQWLGETGFLERLNTADVLCCYSSKKRRRRIIFVDDVVGIQKTTTQVQSMKTEAWMMIDQNHCGCAVSSTNRSGRISSYDARPVVRRDLSERSSCLLVVEIPLGSFGKQANWYVCR